MSDIIDELRFEADAVVTRGIVTWGQRLVLRGLLAQAAEDIEGLRTEIEDLRSEVPGGVIRNAAQEWHDE